AGRLDRVEHPLVVEPEARAELAADAEQALRGGILARLRLLVRARLGDAELLGFDEPIVNPRDEARPRLVTVAREGAERLLADRLAQHEVVGRVRRGGRDRTRKR